VATSPPIRLVVLNFNGGANVLRCLEHLYSLDWPSDELQLVVVDNASIDGSAEAIEQRFPGVELIRLGRNHGFPANNVALRDLAGVRYVGLINNDAFVEPGFLGPLVEGLDADGELGAVSPLMIFEHQFIDLTVEVPASRPGRGDPRELGVRITGLRVDDVDGWTRAQVSEGGHGPEVGRHGRFEWTSDRATIRVPVERHRDPPATIVIEISALTPRTATFTSGSRRTQVSVGRAPTWVTVGLGAERYDAVNNAGSVVLADGDGADRGFGERADGSYGEGVDLFAWCGGAVLLRPSYLKQVGLFDESFFLYYEDTDLSWRGRAQGWRYRFVPESRVRHVHAASSVEGSARFHFFTERNRLLMLVKNAPASMVRAALVRFLKETYDAARRDVAGALLQRRRPNTVPVTRRVKALVGFVALLPSAFLARRRLRRLQTVDDAVLMAELTVGS
jgi:GT2 family glycosyltransferase